MDFTQVMRSVWADSLDGIVISDADTYIIDCNPAYCQLSGYTRDELIGKKTNVIRSGLTPRHVFNDMWEDLRGRGRWVGELINQRRDGSVWISFLSITRVVGPDGSLYYVGIARDLTDRRHLEEQLRQQSTRLASLLGSIESGVIMLDTAGQCVVVNRRMMDLAGCAEDEFLDRPRAEVEAKLAHVFNDPQILTRDTTVGLETVVANDSPARYFIQRWGPVVSGSGVALGEIFTFRDVTRETEADRVKSEFTATVSHELRTPMTSIKGALGLLLGGATGAMTDPQRELLTIAQKNIDRLIRLINDILDLSRVDSGRLELHLEPTNMNEVVAAAVRELEAVRLDRKIELQTELTSDLPLAKADPDRIGQVLVNLLGNAFKFTEPGTLVTVRTSMIDGQVLVQVKDNGQGVSAAELHRIFERFQRTNSAASRKAGGTGLGLAIAESIIAGHGGRIWAESELGQGATFSFTLPVHLLGTTPDLVANQDDAQSASSPTVLVCDDDPDIVALLKAALQHEGFNVLTAASGEEALKLCVSERVDCVTLDLSMPGMDGLEVARHLKGSETTRHIPVVVVSAYIDAHHEELALLGVTGVVAKPIQPDRLLDQIAGVLGVTSADAEPPDVLVVDDDFTIRRVVALTLAEAGYRVRTASDGVTAVAAIKERLPDLLVADVLMPNLDGFRLVRTLQQQSRTRRIPLVVLTALDLSDSDRRSLRLGPTAHLAKGPRLREQLIQTVKEMIDK